MVEMVALMPDLFGEGAALERTGGAIVPADRPHAVVALDHRITVAWDDVDE
jgi:hypothetical protein